MVLYFLGEKLTTASTDIPTTTIILPTPGSNDSYEITVFLGGKNADEYKQNDVQKRLKEMIRDMAIEYCKTENFNLAESITWVTHTKRIQMLMTQK